MACCYGIQGGHVAGCPQAAPKAAPVGKPRTVQNEERTCLAAATSTSSSCLPSLPCEASGAPPAARIPFATALETDASGLGSPFAASRDCEDTVHAAGEVARPSWAATEEETAAVQQRAREALEQMLAERAARRRGEQDTEALPSAQLRRQTAESAEPEGKAVTSNEEPMQQHEQAEGEGVQNAAGGAMPEHALPAVERNLQDQRVEEDLRPQQPRILSPPSSASDLTRQSRRREHRTCVPADRCGRCGQRRSFVLGMRGFGWRARYHDRRCMRVPHPRVVSAARAQPSGHEQDARTLERPQVPPASMAVAGGVAQARSEAEGITQQFQQAVDCDAVPAQEAASNRPPDEPGVGNVDKTVPASEATAPRTCDRQSDARPSTVMWCSVVSEEAITTETKREMAAVDERIPPCTARDSKARPSSVMWHSVASDLPVASQAEQVMAPVNDDMAPCVYVRDSDARAPSAMWCSAAVSSRSSSCATWASSHRPSARSSSATWASARGSFGRASDADEHVLPPTLPWTLQPSVGTWLRWQVHVEQRTSPCRLQGGDVATTGDCSAESEARGEGQATSPRGSSPLPPHVAGALNAVALTPEASVVWMPTDTSHEIGGDSKLMRPKDSALDATESVQLHQSTQSNGHSPADSAKMSGQLACPNYVSSDGDACAGSNPADSTCPHVGEFLDEASADAIQGRGSSCDSECAGQACAPPRPSQCSSRLLASWTPHVFEEDSAPPRPWKMQPSVGTWLGHVAVPVGRVVVPAGDDEEEEDEESSGHEGTGRDASAPSIGELAPAPASGAVETCHRCGKRLGFILGIRGFGWRASGHEERCAKRFEKRRLREQQRQQTRVNGNEEQATTIAQVPSRGGVASDTPRRGLFRNRWKVVATASALAKLTDPVPPLTEEEEQETRLIFELCDDDCSKTISMHEFAAMCVKHVPVANFIGFSGVQTAGRKRQRLNTDLLFEEMGDRGREIEWEEFRDFVARRRAQMNNDGDVQGGSHSSRPSLPPDAKVDLVFEMCDENSSGTISLTELAAFLVKRPNVAEMIGLVDRSEQSSSSSARRRPDAEALFREMDADGSKDITLREFRAFVASRRASTDVSAATEAPQSC